MVRGAQPQKNPVELFLFHNNAHPHTILETREAIIDWVAMILDPPYSPDHLFPSDCYPFGSLKAALTGTSLTMMSV